MKVYGKTGYFMGYNQALKDVIALIKQYENTLAGGQKQGKDNS
jgi:hypothetical protein